MQHIIIGSGPAGVVAAETLRKASPRSSIALIGDEPEPPYSRMAIPYYLVNKVDEAGTYLRKTEGYFDSRSIDVIQDRVTGVDSVNKSVKLASGGSRSFDKLLIASGSTAVKPPIEGISLPGVHNCWTLEDARKIIQLAKPGSSVVLMGAGFIGCIILEALASRDVQLTVVEMENRMVPRMMNEHSGGLIKRWCESKGVKVLTSTKVTAINQDADGRLNVCMGMGNS
ncbi:MAG: NADPH-dependent 2,4-dienoyl-CoA reductase/sulfur reductase-like enzyme, partial [Parasphingorhabdus sp.]